LKLGAGGSDAWVETMGCFERGEGEDAGAARLGAGGTEAGGEAFVFAFAVVFFAGLRRFLVGSVFFSTLLVALGAACFDDTDESNAAAEAAVAAAAAVSAGASFGTTLGAFVDAEDFLLLAAGLEEGGLI